MVRLFVIVVALCWSLNSIAQKKDIQLIVRGDDMGYTHSGNVALIKSFKEGIQKSIEVIVPSPWFPEAVKMLKENPGVDIGIHIALTSEWDNVKWRPLTDCKSLKDSNGYFFPMVYPNKNYPGQSIVENNATIEDIEMEIRAQIEMAKKHLPGISHISGHMGCTNLNADVRALISKLSKEYGFISESELKNLSYLGFSQQWKTAEEKIDKFLELLDKMEAGKTYLFVEHPGIDNEELRAVHHIGYENVASDRQGVTDMFTSSKVKAKIAEKKIKLIGYGDLRTEYISE